MGSKQYHLILRWITPFNLCFHKSTPHMSKLNNTTNGTFQRKLRNVNKHLDEMSMIVSFISNFDFCLTMHGVDCVQNDWITNLPTSAANRFRTSTRSYPAHAHSNTAEQSRQGSYTFPREFEETAPSWLVSQQFHR
jgi:hypothetical protein